MQDSSAFQYLAIDLIDVSATNPRRTFDEGKLQELAESIRQHGLIQPIVVRPKNERFEIVAGERRYRSSLLEREIAAHPGMVQIENGWRSLKERRSGAIQLAHVREIETVVENPDAEPALPCEANKAAIIVYGKRIGTTLTVCTDWNCPVHDPEAAAEQTADPTPAIAPAPEDETEEEDPERQREYEQRRREYEEEQQRKEEERRQQFEREQAEREAEQARREKLRTARNAAFERILDNAPLMFTAAQLRMFLTALVNLDPYGFIDDVAAYFRGDDEKIRQASEEVLASTIASLPDDKLTGFALRLVLTGHTAVPREDEFDFLAEAEAAFIPPQSKKSGKPKKAKAPTPSTSHPRKQKSA
jgi:ParB family transcriptional regulator, chromosome partitioning protein